MIEGDIKGCFDNINHHHLMDRLRLRIADQRVMELIGRFLKAGVLAKISSCARTAALLKVGSSRHCLPTLRLAQSRNDMSDGYITRRSSGATANVMARQRQ